MNDDGWYHFKHKNKLIGLMRLRAGESFVDVRDYAMQLAAPRRIKWWTIDICRGPGTLPAEDDAPHRRGA